MQQRRENDTIDFQKNRYKYTNWASIDAQEGLLTSFENQSPLCPKYFLKSVFIKTAYTVLIKVWLQITLRVTYNTV